MTTLTVYRPEVINMGRKLFVHIQARRSSLDEGVWDSCSLTDFLLIVS